MTPKRQSRMPGFSAYGGTAIAVLLNSGVRAQQAANCFWPDGTRSTPENYYLPCDGNSNDTYSTCCAAKDMCTTNGLCKSLDDAGNNKFWRNGCTDPTWRSPNCVNHCLLNPETGTLGSDSWQVWACTQTTWCCAPSPWVQGWGANYSCCDTPGAVFDIGPAVSLSGKKFATTQFPVTMATTSASRMSSAAASTTVAPTSTGTTGLAAPSPTASQGLGTGATAGIGVGAAVIAILLAAAAWFTLRSRKYRKVAPNEIASLAGHERQMAVTDRAAEKPGGYTSVYASEADSNWHHELGNNQLLRDRPVEMTAERFERQELP